MAAAFDSNGLSLILHLARHRALTELCGHAAVSQVVEPAVCQEKRLRATLGKWYGGAWLQLWSATAAATRSGAAAEHYVD